jgi:hypothetical protein
MADGLLTQGLNYIDQQKQALAARLGLLANNPDEFGRQMAAEARQRAGVGLLGEPKTAKEMASGEWINSPYGQQAIQAGSGFAGSIIPVKKEVLNIASKNAEKMLGLPKGNTAMDRAKAMGFDMSEYHGTGVGDFPAFDPSKMKDNVQYGGSIYTTKDPAFASRVAESKWSGDYPTVMPLMIRSGKKFDMTEPISAKDAANVLRQIGQYERADAIEASGKPYRSGAEFFYFGIGHDLSNPARGSAINRGGFDVITGDPSMEIAGKAGRPQTAIFDPSRLRSRFAAFDPARIKEPDLLAAGVPLGLLAGTNIEMPKKEKRK